MANIVSPTANSQQPTAHVCLFSPIYFKYITF